MKLQTSQIDLDSLKVDESKIDFSLDDNQEEIEYLARSIVDLEGWSIRIPVVREIGIEEYELESGYFEYYALLKAREIDPDLPDRIRVFIINKNNQESVITQLEAIEKIENIYRHQSEQYNNDNQNIEDIKVANLSAKIRDSEKAIISHLNDLKATILDDINSKIPKPLPLLDAFNQILDDRVCDRVLKKMSFLGKKKAEKIVNQLREHKKKDKTEFKTFQNVLDVLEKRSISPKKFLEVIDNWN